MPRSKKERDDGFYDRVRNAQNKAKGFTQSIFVQRELNADEKQMCKAWNFSVEDAVAALETLVEQDYKVTFRWDARSKAPTCWIIAPDDHPVNAGKILPGRGSEAWKAFKQAAFKAQVLFHGEAWPVSAAESQEEFDD